MKRYQLISNQAAICILIGMAGFLFATFLLSGKTTQNRIPYQELILSDKDSVTRVIYGNKLSRFRASVKTVNDTALQSKLLLNKWIAGIVKDSLAFESSNTDTSLKYFAKLMVINRSRLKEAIVDTIWNSHPDTVRQLIFTHLDTNNLPPEFTRPATYSLSLRKSQYTTLTSFFDNNSIAGFWLILSIGQMAFWCLIIAILAGMINNLRKSVTGLPAGLISYPNWLLSAIVPLLFFGIFGFIFYYYLIDTIVIKDHYFMDGFNTRMLFYAVVGYLAAVACFGMYLLMAMSLDQLNKRAIQNNQNVKNNVPLQENYTLLKNSFDGSFLATAFILSFFVFWLGLLFTAVNQTEIMQFYKLYAGKDFLSFDQVYLVAAMHTIILLLFYVPVKIKFNAMKITQDDKQGNALSGNKVLSSISESFLTLMVTASPLLTGIIQKLITGLLN